MRADNPLEPVIVAPLFKASTDKWRATERGERARYAIVRSLEAESIVADLGRAFSITKRFLAGMMREPGFIDPDDAARFALSIERMFGRFAFPDGFNETVQRLRGRIFSAHRKAESEVGEIYRSIHKICVRAAPSWDDPNAEIAFIFVLNDEPEAEVIKILDELEAEVGRMTLPGNLKWSNPRYYAGGADELSARDILESQLLDVHIVSGPS